MIGAEISGAWADTDPPEIQAIGVPADPDRQIPVRQPIRVEFTSLGQKCHLRVRGVEPGAAQFVRVPRRAKAVLRIMAFIPATAVVDEREELDHLQIGAGCGCQQAAVDENPEPVILPVEAIVTEFMGLHEISEEFLADVL
jgi:hypothetical protein